DSAPSAGTLRLLREGARLVRDADDILEDLAGLSRVEPQRLTPETTANPAPITPVVPPGLDDGQRRVWELLGDGSQQVDELVRATNVPVAQMNGLLMMLEMKKIVRRLPG